MRAAQKSIVLVMVVLLAAGSQAEICPMELARQLANHCGNPTASMHQAQHEKHKSHEHDCCPSGVERVNTQSQAKQLLACDSRMTCCSLDPQPASPKSPKFVQPEIGAAPKIATELSLAKVASKPAAAAPYLQESVFRHKEDLRI